MQNDKSVFDQIHSLRKKVVNFLNRDIKKSEDEFSFQLNEFYCSIKRVIEYIEGIAKIHQEELPEKIEHFIDDIVYMKVELFEEAFDHCKKLKRPLDDFIKELDKAEKILNKRKKETINL